LYHPPHFVQDDRRQIAALIEAHPLGALCHAAQGVVSVDHVPLLYDPNAGAHGTLRGHVARANPLWREAAGRTVLAVFQGPHGYVSPSWYASKAAGGKVVPTWNYAVVHARGVLRAIDDAAWLRAFVERLTRTREDNRPHPWHVADAPADYIDQMLRAIVGIEVEVVTLEAKWKVSQNRSVPDRAGVAEGLRAEGTDAARALAAMVPIER
jgi:transcriptional regulator